MIYFDNCATTRVNKDIAEAMMRSMYETFGNPSSLHRKGMEAENIVKTARKVIADYLDVETSEICFTSGGTEGNNLAIQSAVNKYQRFGKHIITTSFEHSSVDEQMKVLENSGFEIEHMPMDEWGNIDLDEFEKMIREDTILVSAMHVNNEMGAILPISELGNIIKRKNSRTVFHVDGVQGFMKINLNLKSAKVDLYSMSSHKIHGPKGVGALFVNKELKLKPIIFGGGQELNLRSGTENVQGILGLSMAVNFMNKNFEANQSHVLKLKNRLIEELSKKTTDYRINSSLANSSPYVLSISFKDVRGEVLLHFLEEKEIYVSTGSACDAKGTKISSTITALKIPKEFAEGTIRICFSYENTEDEVDIVVTELVEAVKNIRNIYK